MILFGRLERIPTFLVPIINPLLLTSAGTFIPVTFCQKIHHFKPITTVLREFKECGMVFPVNTKKSA